MQTTKWQGIKPTCAALILVTSFMLWVTPASAQRESMGEATWTVGERGPHHRIWTQFLRETNRLGQVSERPISSYTELQTGLHVWDGQWVESRPTITIGDDAAVVTGCAYWARFAANANWSNAVEVVTPEGLHLRSRVAGISYSEGGKAVLIAATKDSIGVVLGEDQVLYTNAFEGLEADIHYFVGRAGIEQSVVWRGQLPSPESVGLGSNSWLQVITEFFDPPAPARKLDPGGFDELLSFDNMIISRGRAFSIGAEATPEDSVAVSKQWVPGPRTFLVEEVPFQRVAAKLRALGRTKEGASLRPYRATESKSLLAALPPARPKGASKVPTGKMLLAQGDLTDRPGFLLDYTLLTAQTNFTLAANTNYYVSGLVNLSGTTRIEGGTIIKFTNHTSAKISMSGPLICQTEQYRPAVLTSKDDNTVGETITGSTGNPTNYDGGTYLYSSVSDPTNAVQYLRLSYAGTGLAFDGLTNGVWHCQFLKCQNAIDSYNQKEVRLYNVLMAVSSNCIVNSTNVRGQHVTVDVCSNLVSAASPSLQLTNSILTAVAAVGVGSPIYDQVVAEASGEGVYQTVGAASYYLADGSTNRNAGGTGLATALVDALALRTTYPPVVINTNITAATFLSPQALRDTDAPDLGYHYDPLDFSARTNIVTADLCLTNGVAVATWGATLDQGLRLDSGNFMSSGAPDKLNWVVRYHTVQEQSTTNWASTTAGIGIQLWNSAASVNVKFTGWSLLGMSGNHFKEQSGVTGMPVFNHSRFCGGTFTVNPTSLALTNCLWERAYVWLETQEDEMSWYLQNNCFIGGRFYYRNTGSDGIMLAKDNLFDRTVIAKGISGNSFTHDYNAYVTNQNRLTPTNFSIHDVILTNAPVYETSHLGRYFYPTNDGMLSRLLNAGSVSDAAQIGLYHFTTTTNQVKEANSTNDIGFHYVAADASGQPLDTDGDGLADYLEDSNGNGSYSGSTDLCDWQDVDTDLDGFSDGEEVLIYHTNPEVADPPGIAKHPQSIDACLGGSAPFSVTPSGLILSSYGYQWRFNGTNIAGQTAGSFVRTNVSAADVGSYTVVVTNAGGSVTSAVASLQLCGAIVFTNFTDSSLIQFNGNAVPTNTALDGAVLQLTPAITNQSGSAFLKPRICLTNDGSFSTYFAFRLSQGDGWADADCIAGADGISFTVQNVGNTALTDGGGRMGYIDITNSISVEFDTWYNTTGGSDWDPNLPNGETNNCNPLYYPFGDGNHVGLSFNGTNTSAATAHIYAPLNTGSVWYAWIDYHGGTSNLEVRLSVTATRPELPVLTNTFRALNYLSTSNVWLGFTAGTGGSYNQQDILFWQFKPYYEPIGSLPAITILYPTNNQLFVEPPASIPLWARATNNGGADITGTAFFDGTTGLGSTNGMELLMFLTNFTAGNYTNTAWTTNSTGQTASTNVWFIINARPWITNDTPTNIEAFVELAHVGLTNTAWDTDGTVTNVTFYTWTNSVPAILGVGVSNDFKYSLTWSNRGLGLHSYYAVAQDNRGAQSVSPIGVFRVNPPDAPSTVAITFPTNNATFREGVDITITATATPRSGATVTNVEFFVDNRLLGSDTSSPYSLTECCWKKGHYKLTAKAEDSLGGTAVSAIVEMTVADPIPNESNGHWDQAFGQVSMVRGEIRVLATDTNGNLYAGGCAGDFVSGVGPIAQWTGSNWLDLHLEDSGSPRVHAIKQIGNEVWVGGEFVNGNAYNLAAWDGTQWSAKCEQLYGAVRAIAVVGSDVYIGGDFTQVGNDQDVKYIAKRAGSSWVPVGDGLVVTNGVGVRAIASIGNELYIGGDFTGAGSSSSIQYVAKLVGTNWVALGSGVDARVRAFAVCGQDLFVGGDFLTAGGNTNANCIARWREETWTPLGAGVSGPVTNATCEGGCEEDVHSPSVYTIALHGYELFAGGLFSTVRNGTNEITANCVAKATWSGPSHEWNWSALEGGVTHPIQNGAYVLSSLLRESASTNGYEFFVGGRFRKAGNKPCEDIARWVVGMADYPIDDVPAVWITNPTNGQVFTAPSSISISATATGAISIDSVEFFIEAESIGVGTRDGDDYSITWTSPASGVHAVSALATTIFNGSAVKSTLSKPIYVKVKSATGPTAVDDEFTVGVNYPRVTLNVLGNDTATGNNTLRVTQVTKPLDSNGGDVQIGYQGQNVVYTPNPNSFGTDIFYYTITDSQDNSDSARIVVNVRAAPVVSITSPYDAMATSAPANLVITGNAQSYSLPITNIAIYLNGTNQLSQTNATTFGVPWTTNVPGFYTFSAVAADSAGITNVSLPVTIAVTNTSGSNQQPVAQITNLVNTVSNSGTVSVINPALIQEGLFNLKGQARDPDPTDPVSYRVQLYLPIDSGILVANVTPPPLNAQGFHDGTDNAGDLGILDLTGLTNGIYDLELTTHGGGDSASTVVRVQLDSLLKIGQFSFSEQDMVIPVSGIPLTVVRTYNSLNTRAGDFGVSWTYALNSMDVQLDEDRKAVTIGTDEAPFADIEEDAYGRPLQTSLRLGGSHDVTLTLPDGRRTTFAFTPQLPTFYPWVESSFNGYAKWTAPPDVRAKLTVTGSDVIRFFGGEHHGVYWTDGGPESTFEMHDVPGWELEAEDGTKYRIERGQPNRIVYYDWDEAKYRDVMTYDAQPKLTSIVQRSGDVIKITDAGVAHYAFGTNLTRSLFMQRDEAGRIVALFDPNSGVTNDASALNAKAVVKYVYNRDSGNLIRVHRLQDRAAGTYTVTKYHYDHPKFPHFITSIEDPRGIPLARNEYDDSGRLTAVVDADGKRTEFEHLTSGNLERVIDRNGHTNVFVYDSRGNVTATTNAVGQITTMRYDEFNQKTNEVLFLDGQPYATNISVLSEKGFLLASIDALGQSNSFTYNDYGQVLVSVSPCGCSGATNFYDTNTGNLLATSDALGNTTSNFYSGGLLTGTRDALGNVTTNYYDNLGNPTANAVLQNGSLAILSTNSFEYDQNGNRTVAVTWRRVSGTWTGATNRTIYDAQNRAVQTVNPDGGTNTVVFNSIGKQEMTIEAGERTNRFVYDAQGRLFQTTYADGSSEFSYFDAEGRVTNRVDRAEHSTLSIYDAVGRVTQTIYADNTTNGTIYDGLGRVQFSVDASGVTNAIGYDLLGRRVAVTNAWGTSAATTNLFGYDVNGNQPYVTNALGVVTTNVFDALNRVTEVKLADGTRISTGYDAVGRRVAETNQDSIVTLFGYDGAGRLTSVTNALGTAQQMVTRYEYDEAGNQTAQIDALLRTNRYAYDNMGRRTSHTMPDTTLVEQFSYDLSGNLIRHTDFNGVIITNRYDVLNRLTNRSSIAGYSVSFGYAVSGQRTNLIDPSGTTAYAYDVRDRLTNKVVAWTGGPTRALNYRYNANGNLTNLWSDSTGGVTNYFQYDALGRLTNVLGRGGVSAGYSFDAVGNLQTVSYGNGVTNRYRYDLLNRLTNAVWKLNTTTLGDFTYALGLSGHRTNLSETVSSASRAYAWQYDGLQRLTNETVTGASPTGTIGYGYDLVGNRTNRSGGLLASQSLAYNTNDWLTTDVYDANGNTRTNAGNQPYFYDVENRLTNFNNGAVLMAYNGDGARVTKTVGSTTTYYLVDDRNPSGYVQVLEEHVSINNQPSTLNRCYNYGLDLFAQSEAGGTVHYFGYDGHGSTRFLMNGSTVANVFAYDAYGTLIASNATAQTTYLYCSEQFDGDLGFYYLRARYLNPNTGRFWTADSYQGSPSDPFSLHKYLYCRGNPANRIDPMGSVDLDFATPTISFGVLSALSIRPVPDPSWGWLELTIDTVILFGVDDRIDKDFELANSILKQAHIRLKRGESKSMDSRETERLIGRDGALRQYGKDLKPTTEELALTKSQNTKRVTAYYVMRFDPDTIDGQAMPEGDFRSPPAPSIFMKDAPNPITFAHELGHVLLKVSGLVHEDDANNLMAAGDKTRSGRKLVWRQCFRMRETVNNMK